MQPQQQQVVIQQPGVVQPMYIAQPVTRSPVVKTYAHRQSTLSLIGILLIVAGALSIIFNTVDLAVGSRATYTTTNTYTGYSYNRGYIYTRTSISHSLTVSSLGFVCHGLWCGAPVSITRSYASARVLLGRRRNSMGKWDIRPPATPKLLSRSLPKVAYVIRAWIYTNPQKISHDPSRGFFS